MQVASGGDAHFIMRKTHLQRRAFWHVVPGFDDRYICLGDHLLGARAVKAAGQHQRCRRPAEKGTHRAFFLFDAEIAGGQQQLVTVTTEGVAEALQRIGKNRPRDIRNHHRDDFASRRGQATGHQIGHIPQLRHHLGDTLAALGRDLFRLVEVTRHGNGRHPGLARHGVEGDAAGAPALARFVFVHGTILKKEYKTNFLVFDALNGRLQ